MASISTYDLTIGNSKNSIVTKWDGLIFKSSLVLFLIAFASTGLGNHLLGIELPSDISTIIIYLIFFLQLISNSLQFSKILLISWFYIFVHTFLLNWYYINFVSSIKHFIGLVLFSLVTFSFFSKNRFRIVSIIQVYYKFCLLIVCIAILQMLLFVIFKVSFLPQNLLSGFLVFSGGNNFQPEILDIFPRLVSLSTEPAHFVILILPATYISLLVLTGSGYQLGIFNRPIAAFILFGFIMSFSLVGYFGLLICFISIFWKKVKTNFIKTSAFLIGFIALFFFILQTTIGEKVYSFLSVSKDITGTQYAATDMSSFALLSNLMVALEGLKISNCFGTGLNTHVITYDAKISSIFSASQIPMELNKENAGSLFIRIPSEFGIPGLIAFIGFLLYYRVSAKGEASSIKSLNSMCLVFLIAYGARSGHYLNVVFFFILALYYYTSVLHKTEVK
jgi:hypothetical protein